MHIKCQLHLYIFVYIYIYIYIKSHKNQDECNIYAIMKTMCSPGYHHNGFVAAHALGHMMYGCTLMVPMNSRGSLMTTYITLLG